MIILHLFHNIGTAIIFSDYLFGSFKIYHIELFHTFIKRKGSHKVNCVKL